MMATRSRSRALSSRRRFGGAYRRSRAEFGGQAESQRRRLNDMSSKSRVRKHSQSAMSPLLRALTFSRTAHEPVTTAMVLQAYSALDAFRHSHGSRTSPTTLSRRVL